MKFHQKPHTYVGEVYLKVKNLPRSLTFYKDIIGFQVLEQSARKAVLSADGATPLVTIEQPDGILPKQPRTTGLYHFALLLPNRAELGSLIHHFVDKNLRLQGASDHLVSEALYLSDPDGNGIEVYADRAADTWDWNNEKIVMATEPLDIEDLMKEGEGRVWNGLPDDTVMGHIHLHVSELKKTEEFYRDGLGFQLVNRYGNQALFMSTGKYHHHIGLNTWNGVGAPAPDKNSVGLEWFTLVLPSVETKNKVLDQLQGIDAPIKEEKGNVFTFDPSGNKIRLLNSN